MGPGRRSRASRDVTAAADGIRPPGLSDDLWQRFLQVRILDILHLCRANVQPEDSYAERAKSFTIGALGPGPNWLAFRAHKAAD